MIAICARGSLLARMASYPFRALLASTVLILAGGCATGPMDSEVSTSSSTGEGASSEREARTESASSERRAESTRETVAPETTRARETLAADTTRARESAETTRGSRSEALRDREAVNPARERVVAELRGERAPASDSSRSSSGEGRTAFSASSLHAINASSAENAKLAAQLNEASRELAALRAANAKLSAERPRTTAARDSSPRGDPADDKIAASVRSYAQFKQELTALMSEAEKARSEHTLLNEKLRDAMARAEDARSALARAESDLKKEKNARAEAEQAAAKLREQLRTIARAVSSAGLNLDKIADGASGK